jgi:hypothetical protein
MPHLGTNPNLDERVGIYHSSTNGNGRDDPCCLITLCCRELYGTGAGGESIVLRDVGLFCWDWLAWKETHCQRKHEGHNEICSRYCQRQ